MTSLDKERQKGVVHLIPLLVISILIGVLVLKASVKTEPGPVFQDLVLGENSGSGSEDKEDEEDHSGSNSGSSEDSSVSSFDEQDEPDEVDEVEVRIESDDDEDEDDSTRLRLERRDRTTSIELDDDEDEDEDHDSDDDEDDDEDEGEIEIEIEGPGGKFKFSAKRNRVRVRTNFPLSLDTETNELIVTTPAGEKRVAVLPDEAIANLLANGVVDVVFEGDDGEDDDTATDSAVLGNEFELELEEEEGELVYKIEGYDVQKLIGLFDVFVPKTVTVSSEDGEVLGTAQTLLSRLLDLLSF